MYPDAAPGQRRGSRLFETTRKVLQVWALLTLVFLGMIVAPFAAALAIFYLWIKFGR